MFQNSVYDILLLIACNDPDRSAATGTDLNVDVKYALEPLYPGHCRILLGG